MKEQLRKYRAGLLKPWQVRELRKAGAIKAVKGKKERVTWKEIYESACAPDPKRSAAARKAWKTRRAQAVRA